jgi:hypothetical protein
MSLTRMQQRRGVASQWAAVNPILGSGEIGFEIDNSRFKIGDGITTWSNLEYFSNEEDINTAIEDAIAGVIDLSPETLDTLKELAEAINNDPDFYTNVVSRSGDTMTGDLTLPNDPTEDLHAATKQYVDQAEADAKSYTDEEISSLIESGETITPGGETGQVLAKASDDDYDTEWVNPTGLLGDLSDVETYDVSDKDTLVYDEVLGLWLPGPGGGRFNVGETPPAEPLNGDTWLDSITGNTYLYYEDYDSPQWIQIGGPGITVTRGASLFIQTTAPGAPVEGDIWYDSAEGFTYLYYVDADSSQWIQFGLNRNGAPGEIREEDLVAIESDIIPSEDDTYNLGSEYYRWANIYTADLHLKNNESNPNSIDGTWGNYTIQEGEENLFIVNNRTGKKYKFLIEEVD